jgi:undecaprenyl diphosphate synthase
MELLPENSFKHVAIIMDGNGRWANCRSHKRVWGHIRGASIVSSIVEEADDLNIKALTLYAFSTENWSRPLGEVKILFSLLKKFLKKERNRIIKNKIRFDIIGDYSKVEPDTCSLIENLISETKENTGLKLTFAFGYGSRDEIVKTVNSLIRNNPGKEITENDIEESLFTKELGDVDLMIRTGGDQRISNFLLWQSAYAELHFTETKWPDFSAREFREIYSTVSHRERRFGYVSPTSSIDKAKKLAKTNINNLTRI